MTKTLLGWREWIELPDLGLGHIKAKVDTGARSSSLHAFDIHPMRQHGRDYVAFKVHPKQRNDHYTVHCLAPIKDYRRVTDSGGHRSMRYVIDTTLKIDGELYVAEITLTDRSDMLFRMLLGRTALKGRFHIDPAKSFCTGKPAKK